MSEASVELPTFRYVLKVNGKVVFHGFTTNLELQWRRHKRRWPDSEIEQVGDPTTHELAYDWANAHPTGTDPRI